MEVRKLPVGRRYGASEEKSNPEFDEFGNDNSKTIEDLDS
jgi:hypothetical protein